MLQFMDFIQFQYLLTTSIILKYDQQYICILKSNSYTYLPNNLY